MALGAPKGRSRIGVGNPAPVGRKPFTFTNIFCGTFHLASASYKEAHAHSRGANKQLN
jgi:hypothetical protein